MHLFPNDMNSFAEKSDFKCITWNARSITNKKLQCESLILQHNPDLIGISETWLSEKTKFNIKGFNCIRCDRNNPSPGGGTAIFLRDSYIFDKIDLYGPWMDFLQIAGIRINSIIGLVYVISIYIPPNAKISLETITGLANKIPSDGKLILMGDLNAHFPNFAPFKSNRMGILITQLQELLNINIISDGENSDKE